MREKSHALFVSLVVSSVPTLAAMLSVSGTAMATMSPSIAPNAVASDWWSVVHSDLINSEYGVQQNSRTPFGEGASALQAANRGQNLRTFFTPDGFRSLPRDVKVGETSPWSWGLSLVAWGRENAMDCIDPVAPRANGNRVQYERGTMTEWYINDARGLEQGFTIEDAAPSTLPLRLEFAVTGELTATLADAGATVEFLGSSGQQAIRFAKLHVFDATGRTLAAAFEVDGTDMAIVVDDRGAIYPIVVDPLATSPSWTGESDQLVANYGYSVSTAGDVNGDGYSDVIVGAPFFDNGQLDTGRAYVYYGSANGLSATADWFVDGGQALGRFGYGVATAGDVNGDGYDDVVVGSPVYDNGQTDEGRAFVYYGSASGLSATAGWTAEGNQMSAFFGSAVATAGDVNGDGYSDVIIGALGYHNGQADEGRAFVYHGSASGLSASANWTAESNQANARFATSVSTAGDVNNDGFGDVIIGAPLFDMGENDEGRAVIYLGSAAGLASAISWHAEGNQAAANYGNSVATAGDVNGDGYDDVIVAAYLLNISNPDMGRIYAYYGSARGVSASANWTADGDQFGANLGTSVASAGDIDHDGFSDVIAGAFGYNNGQQNEGRAYVYGGSATGLKTDPVWTAESDQAGAFFGASVSSAGDVNGDGFSDVIVGAPYYNNPDGDEGGAFVYLGFGKAITGDLNNDGAVNALDLGILLGAWGSANRNADLNGDGDVNASDLGLLLGGWTG